MSKGKKETKTLFVYSYLPSFVCRDLEILERHFTVKNITATTFLLPRKGRDPWLFLRKKCMIVIGGYEVANVPEINYGALNSVLNRVRVRFILEHASKVLAVSQSSGREITRFTKPKRLELVYNGVDTEEFKPLGVKENLVITVGKITDSTINKKRFDIFVQASRYLPDIQFVVIGKYDCSVADLKRLAGSNVIFTGYLSNEALLRYYQSAKVYCQLSTQESFGVALAEAMSCCCVPVTTRRYALPEVVDDTGFYVPYDDPKATADAIRNALKSDKGIKARNRIKKCFSIKTREKKLIAEILDLARC